MSIVAALGILLLLAGCAPESPTSIIEILAAADRRPTSDADLLTIRSGLDAVDPETRRIAVRSLGRLEQPQLLPTLVPKLADPDPDVRATAAWALAQSVSRDDGGAVIAELRAALRDDPAGIVRAAAAVSLGRLHLGDPAALTDVVDALVTAPASVDAGAASAPLESEPVVLGIARGLEAVVRTNTERMAVHPEVKARLHELLAYSGVDPLSAARVRALALAALSRLGPLPAETLRLALGDPEAEVRRLAAMAAAAVEDSQQRDLLLDRGITDPDPRVRFAALPTPPQAGTGPDCRRIVAAMQDPDPHVRLRAIDLADRCPRATARLARLARRVASGARDDWHETAHALVAFARADPQQAAAWVASGGAAEPWQMRMYVARAATLLGDTATLDELALDAVPNVQNEALLGLRQLPGHRAESTCLAALKTADDAQLLITAAACLTGTSSGTVVVAPLFTALDRISARQQETSRDARMALLDRIDELGTTADGNRLRPYLRDYDPRIAGRVAEILHDLTGDTFAAAPRPPPPVLFPTAAQLDEIATARAVLHMRGGGEIVLHLLPWEAPTNARRFVDLARRGTLDGVTFHRVVPNFVIQGGSPGANEYAGHGAYTRDELTDRSHLRGTVGISTRGRDTGDGQIFINLVDNVRLDHAYTIFAEVTAGYEVFDRVLEGAVIESVDVRSSR